MELVLKMEEGKRKFSSFLIKALKKNVRMEGGREESNKGKKEGKREEWTGEGAWGEGKREERKEERRKVGKK